MVRLDVEGVRFSHGSKEILKGLDFSISNGEVVGILGQNGSGKTTLLNCINTEYRPTSGRVAIADFSRESVDGDHDLGEIADVRDFSDMERSRILSTVEQNSQQSFPFTVLETVRMGRYSRTGMFDEDDEAELDFLCRVMDEVGILGFSDRNINELSGGEWRRVMIAQALAQEPEVLLLDEPTLHLDINHQFDLMDMCRRIVRDRNILIVIVTHDLQLAARFCDRIIVMEHGKITASGTPKETITPEMIRRVFHMRARVEYNEEIKGMSVFLIGKADRAGL
ncbi:MAG: ABC transporter ATP-binding protein [Candidatus Methanomethylophilus sp.]|jgi:iron complex transport system ATP-binding protein|nr:ABC transporter ATP-binding protein [Methanomethylophilus sp.]MCI2074724.1 ABC transporter ATP-binding protein [Methanomethylophilus sp.]MCI2093390.1 ABC transporter ATP-binding protein [Methanomethylophilus sp.]